MRRARAGGVGVAGELLVVRGACPLLPFRSAPAYVHGPEQGVAVRPPRETAGGTRWPKLPARANPSASAQPRDDRR